MTSLNTNANFDYTVISSDNTEDCYAEYQNWEWATGDCDWEQHGGTWYSKTPIRVEIDIDEYAEFYLVKELRNLEEDIEEPNYSLVLSLVSIDMMSEEQLSTVSSTFDWDCYNRDHNEEFPLYLKLADVHSYGYCAVVYEAESTEVNGYQELFKQADEVAIEVASEPDEYLNMSQGYFAHTGWHRIMGVM